jgi:hypothetical protein
MSMPPRAAPKGRIAFLNVESSPFISCLFISRPARRKKKAMRKLLIHSRGEPGRWRAVAAVYSVFHPLVYHAPPELEIRRETIVQPMSRIPVERLSLRKYLRGVMMRWWRGLAMGCAVDISKILYYKI